MLQSCLTKIKDTLDSFPNSLKYFFGVYGAYKIFQSSLKLAGVGYRNLIRSSHNLPTRYGLNSWAIVTGAARGIGKTWAQKLVSLNFNIILIDINPQVQLTSKTISDTYSVQTIPIIVDLSLPNSINTIISQTHQLDISIIVNNAGLICNSAFRNADISVLQNIINVNALAATKLTHAFIGKMVQRPKKSALIYMGSIAGIAGQPFNSVYAGTKAYLRMFGASLQYEQRDQLDVLIVEPTTVITEMSKDAGIKFRAVSTQQCVEGALKDLGHQVESYGAMKHRFIIWDWCNQSFHDQLRRRADFMKGVLIGAGLEPQLVMDQIQ